jgi:glycosyltransferase involved in cell wall biosynthesis
MGDGTPVDPVPAAPAASVEDLDSPTRKAVISAAPWPREHALLRVGGTSLLSPQVPTLAEDSRPRHPRISVVVPARNEARNLPWVLGRIAPDVHEVLLVDGDSTDGTVDVARACMPSIRILPQVARGKGAALATGMVAATGDIVVMLDSDASMDPVEIPALVGALLAGADVVKGSRAAPAGGSGDLSGLRTLGNWVLTRVANYLHGVRWRELCYGYAAFWTDVLPVLGLPELVGRAQARQLASSGLPYGHGFEIEALMFLRAARARLRIAEVFSYEHPRQFGESNLATWRDGARVLTAVLRERRYRPTAAPRRDVRAHPHGLPRLYTLKEHR